MRGIPLRHSVHPGCTLPLPALLLPSRLSRTHRNFTIHSYTALSPRTYNRVRAQVSSAPPLSLPPPLPAPPPSPSAPASPNRGYRRSSSARHRLHTAFLMRASTGEKSGEEGGEARQRRRTGEIDIAWVDVQRCGEAAAASRAVGCIGGQSRVFLFLSLSLRSSPFSSIRLSSSFSTVSFSLVLFSLFPQVLSSSHSACHRTQPIASSVDLRDRCRIPDDAVITAITV